MAGVSFRPLPAPGDNPALTAFKLATISGLAILAVTHSRAVGAVFAAALSILANMMRLVTSAWPRAGAGGGPK